MTEEEQVVLIIIILCLAWFSTVVSLIIIHNHISRKEVDKKTTVIIQADSSISIDSMWFDGIKFRRTPSGNKSDAMDTLIGILHRDGTNKEDTLLIIY